MPPSPMVERTVRAGRKRRASLRSEPSSTPYCVPESNQEPGTHIQDMTCAGPYPGAGSPLILIVYVKTTVPRTGMKSIALTTSQALTKTLNSMELSRCSLIQSPTTFEKRTADRQVWWSIL